MRFSIVKFFSFEWYLISLITAIRGRHQDARSDLLHDKLITIIRNYILYKIRCLYYYSNSKVIGNEEYGKTA